MIMGGHMPGIILVPFSLRDTMAEASAADFGGQQPVFVDPTNPGYDVTNPAEHWDAPSPS